MESLRSVTATLGLRQLAHEVGAAADPISMVEVIALSRTPQTYEVWTTTGDLSGHFRGEGTDAAVFVTLSGERGSLPEQRLYQPNGNLFETGDNDRFTITGPHIGSLTSIRIRHDNTYPGSAWYLEKVTVRKSGRVWVFWARRWLARDRRIAADCAVDITIPYGGTPIATPGLDQKCPDPPMTAAGGANRISLEYADIYEGNMAWAGRIVLPNPATVTRIHVPPQVVGSLAVGFIKYGESSEDCLEEDTAVWVPQGSDLSPSDFMGVFNTSTPRPPLFITVCAVRSGPWPEPIPPILVDISHKND